MQEQTLMERNALGRSAYLGALYDARQDSFCQGSLFNISQLPENVIYTSDVHHMDTEYNFDNSFSKRCDKLEVSGELKLSIFAGLINLSGSGKYLKDDQKSSRSVKGTLIYNIKTKEEKVNVFSDAIKEYLSLDALNVTGATHFVGGITWGANTFASFEYSNVEESKQKEVQGKLAGNFKILKISVSGNVDNINQCEENGEHFNMKVYGDVIPDNEELPQNVESAVALMKKTPKYIGKMNNGKGKALMFQLYSLDEVRKYLGLEIHVHSLFRQLTEQSVIRIEHLFDDLLIAKQKLNDIVSDARSTASVCIPREKINEIVDFERNVTISEANLRSEVKETLLSVRSGKMEENTMEAVLIRYLASAYCPNRIEHFTSDQSLVQVKLQWYNALLKKGVRYNMENRNEALESIIVRDRNFYVFIFRGFENRRSEEKWKKNFECFLEIIDEESKQDGKNPKAGFYVYEMADICSTTDGPVVRHYVNGKMETEDVLLERERYGSLSLVKYLQQPEILMHKPNKRAILEIRCPKSIYGNCQPNVCKWSCEKCMEIIEYGFDTFFYCHCGRFAAKNSSFKCQNANHGNAFHRFQADDDLSKMLNQLKPKVELNILILGETGVGKSTFINAFANYLTYEKLEEAETGHIVSLIPTSFTVTDQNFEEKTVSVGKDANEAEEEGASKTQSCRGYVFPFGEKIIRLIDTPGIGDTRGIEQDRVNFANILSFISNYEELNGICVLLKPNNSRLSVVFRFCIQELLCHLHKSASENLIFLFTNARSTFYRPGDTLPPLRKMLNEIKSRPPHVDITLNQNTVYCLDNESFRLLVALNNNVRFSEDESAQYVSSWEKSVKECMRLVDHVLQLKPHKVKESVSLNEARNLIVALSRPIGDITQNIQQNLVILAEQKAKIREAGNDIDQLNKVLYVPAIDLEPILFDQPRTVCASKDCYKLYSVGSIQKIDYVQICHRPCHLKNVARDVINNAELKSCAAMNSNGKCKECKCGWEIHMHIYYENKQVERQVIDSQVENELKRKWTKKEEVAAVCQRLEQRRAILEGEQKIITETSAKFAHFLKHNAITPYNDALADYLDHLISVEESKCAYDKDKKSLVNELHRMKNSYKEEVKTLESNMARSGGLTEISPQKIAELTRRLYQLPETGPTIKKMVDKLEHAKKNEYINFREKIYDPEPIHKRRGKKEGNKVFKYLERAIEKLGF